MITEYDFKNLKSGDKLILKNFHDQGFLHKYFNIEDSFFIGNLDDPDRIDMIHIKSDKSYWFISNIVRECFITIQSLRNHKIEKLIQ